MSRKTVKFRKLMGQRMNRGKQGTGASAPYYHPACDGASRADLIPTGKVTGTGLYLAHSSMSPEGNITGRKATYDPVGKGNVCTLPAKADTVARLMKIRQDYTQGDGRRKAG